MTRPQAHGRRPIAGALPCPAGFRRRAPACRQDWALTVAGSVAGVTTAVNSVRRRRVDLLGALVCAELVLSVGLALATDSPRLVLARAALYLAIGGGALLASSAAGRPITYPAAEPMATKGDPVRARTYAAVWAQEVPGIVLLAGALGLYASRCPS